MPTPNDFPKCCAINHTRYAPEAQRLALLSRLGLPELGRGCPLLLDVVGLPDTSGYRVPAEPWFSLLLLRAAWARMSMGSLADGIKGGREKPPALRDSRVLLDDRMLSPLTRRGRGDMRTPAPSRLWGWYMMGSRSCAIDTAERFGLDATSIEEIWEGRRPCVGVNGAGSGPDALDERDGGV